MSSLVQKPAKCYGQVQTLKRSSPSGSNGQPSKQARTPFTAVSGNYHKAPLASLNRDIQTTGQSKRNTAFAERTIDLNSAGALNPPTKAKLESENVVGISRNGSVSKWVGRMRANSRSATASFFKHTR